MDKREEGREGQEQGSPLHRATSHTILAVMTSQQCSQSPEGGEHLKGKAEELNCIPKLLFKTCLNIFWRFSFSKHSRDDHFKANSVFTFQCS
jgi:hypothetical protein